MKMTTSVTAASVMVCALLLLQCASTLGASDIMVPHVLHDDGRIDGRKLLKVTRMLLAEEADAMPRKDGDAAAPDAFQMRPKRPGALLANMTMDANTTTAANATATANGTDEEGRDLMSCPCYEPGWPPSPACC